MVHYNPHVTRYMPKTNVLHQEYPGGNFCVGDVWMKNFIACFFGWDMGWQSSKWPTKVAKWVTNQDSNKDVSITRVHSSTQGF